MNIIRDKFVTIAATTVVGVFGYLWLQNYPSFRDLNALDSRVMVVEAELAHMPSKDDFAGLQERLARVEANQVQILALLQQIREDRRGDR